tara:strand:- start:353 stop:700 length:348 start_codon:yes stop_codon:yes gene_type:complete
MLATESFVHILKIIATVAIFFVWFIRYENIKKEFSDYNFPSWFRDLVGILKISFIIMLHSSNQEIVIIGSLGIFILMLGAVSTHIRMKNSFRKYIASVTMCIVSALILYFSIQFI